MNTNSDMNNPPILRNITLENVTINNGTLNNAFLNNPVLDNIINDSTFPETFKNGIAFGREFFDQNEIGELLLFLRELKINMPEYKL